jgi:hypothetical protein
MSWWKRVKNKVEGKVDCDICEKDSPILFEVPKKYAVNGVFELCMKCHQSLTLKIKLVEIELQKKKSEEIKNHIRKLIY